MIPTSLYIHLPWCLTKCPYCDFNAHPLKEDTDFYVYVDRLIEDLHTHKALLESRKLTSIFIGGGSPSLLNGKTLSSLFTALKQYQSLDIEITIEANPGTQDYAHYQEYFDLGINRISIGAQSFNPDMLTKLGRLHSYEDTHQAIHIAKQSGFKRINVDIMYGLPHQTIDQAIEDLKIFLESDCEHLSWYQLNIEKNTLFYHEKPNLPDTETIEGIDIRGDKLLGAHQYQQYEISAWTKGQPSLHNLNYWHFGDYIGIGAGAHSKITQNGTIHRLIKHKHPKAYLKKLMQSDEIVDPSELIIEYIINHFRTKSPLYFIDFEERTQLPQKDLINALQKALALSLINIYQDRIELTQKGFFHHNEICLSLL